MRKIRLNIFSVLLLFSCVSCAQEGAEGKTNAHGSSTTEGSRKVELKKSGDILVLVESEKGFFEGSYISMSYGGSSIKAQRIVKVLESVGADEDFISRIGPRLESNRRLKNDSFNLPLTDEDGNVHRFEYMADDENGLYTLNYRFVPE